MNPITPHESEATARLRELLSQRVAVLDGAWGTMLQGAGLTPADYTGDRFGDHTHDVTGDPDLLNITRPDVILDVHRQYLAAGADITTTNTFTATSIGQADYGLQAHVHEMNVRGAQLARQAADEFGGRFVAGSIGPLNVTLSLSPKVDDPAYRAVTFEQVKAAYAEQIAGLVEGGVDLLMIETIFDTLNCKAAIAAARDVAPELPLWISVTIVDLSGRTLSGQTVEAFWSSVEHAKPLVVGVNCSLGAEEMRPHVEELSRIADAYVACHPNAGLPNAFGGYDQTPDETAGLIGGFARDGLVNLVGGCCGTSPAHIEKIAAAAKGVTPREVPAPPAFTRFSGLEPFGINADTGFVMIGERTNVTGSKRFHAAHRVRRPPGRRRRRAGAGPRRGEPAGRQHGRRPARQRGGDDDVPQPHRHRARGRPHPGDGRQLEVDRARSRPALHPGQGRRQLDQPEGGRGAVPRPGPDHPQLRQPASS